MCREGGVYSRVFCTYKQDQLLLLLLFIIIFTPTGSTSTHKNWGGVMVFLSVPLQADVVFRYLKCSGQATLLSHTDGQYADAVEAGVGAGGPACIHTGTGSRGLGWAKGCDCK